MDNRNVLAPCEIPSRGSRSFEESHRVGSLELVPVDDPGATTVSPSLSEELLQAWRADTRCAECGEAVSSPLEAAFLVVSRRVTHARECFVPALLRGYPTLTRLSASAQAAEVIRERHDEAAKGARDEWGER